MRLFFSTGTSSMSCVIAVEELGIPCELIEVSWSKNQNVAELERANPLGAVPTLVLDDGRKLTQNSAVLEYLAEGVAKNPIFLPKPGSYERANVLRWLAFVAADFHKAFTLALRAEDVTTDPSAQKQIEAFARSDIQDYLKHIDASLSGQEFIAGPDMTVADCYLIIVLGWCVWLEIGFDDFPSVAKYLKRTIQRPGVQRALSRQ